MREGWTRVAFGDVVRQVKDRVDPSTSGLERYVAGEHMDTDDLRIRRWGTIGDGYLGPAFHMRFKPGHVLYGSRRTYLRKVAVPDFEGITANTTFVVEPRDPRQLLPDFLPLLMTSERFHRHSVAESKGSVNPYVNFSDLAPFELDLPNLAEQRRCAELFVALHGSRYTLDAVSTAVEQLRASILATSQSRVPTVAPLGDVLAGIDYGSSAFSAAGVDGVPILRIPNVLRGELDLGDLKFVSLSDVDRSRHKVHAGDLLMVRTNGNPAYVGRCIAVPELPTTMVFASYLLRLRPTAKSVRSAFLAELINSPVVRQHVRTAVRSSAGNYNINPTEIRALPVRIPPLSVQDEVLAALGSLNDGRSLIEARSRSAQGLNRLLSEEWAALDVH
jgi:type I restriction enzyme S subunit